VVLQPGGWVQPLEHIFVISHPGKYAEGRIGAKMRRWMIKRNGSWMMYISILRKYCKLIFASAP
jgi:hypothetical protein